MGACERASGRWQCPHKKPYLAGSPQGLTQRQPGGQQLVGAGDLVAGGVGEETCRAHHFHRQGQRHRGRWGRGGLGGGGRGLDVPGEGEGGRDGGTGGDGGPVLCPTDTAVVAIHAAAVTGRGCISSPVPAAASLLRRCTGIAEQYRVIRRGRRQGRRRGVPRRCVRAGRCCYRRCDCAAGVGTVPGHVGEHGSHGVQQEGPQRQQRLSLDRPLPVRGKQVF